MTKPLQNTHRFKATIYKVGINPCVEVPFHITDKMKPMRGYIPVKGKIGNHSFQQTLVPIKNAPYRLYVNGLMLKGSGTQLGDNVNFEIEQDFVPRIRKFPLPPSLKRKLLQEKLLETFLTLSPTRRVEVLRYMAYLKKEESRERHTDSLIRQLKERKQSGDHIIPRIP